MNTRGRAWSILPAAVFCLAACTSGEGQGGSPSESSPASATGNLSGRATSEQLREHERSKVEGKTLAWAPVGLGTPLTEEWTWHMRRGAESLGMEFIVRDADWDPRRQAQAVESLINEQPDVLVVHNFDVQLLAKLIEQAEKRGIYVIQVNMVSNYKSNAFVGADFIRIGRMVAEDIVEACKDENPAKIAIVQGDLNSGTSLEMMKGAQPVFDEHPEIEIVSNQAANWDRTKAHDITATVLQQHPDLCATWGFWDQMHYGAATAVKEAGLAGKVKVFTSDHSEIICQAIGQGLVTWSYAYDVPYQGDAAVTLASYLLQSGEPPGATRAAIYSPITKIDSSNWDAPGMCYDGKPIG